MASRSGPAPTRPAALANLPAFAREKLDPARCGGDIVIQACADDVQVALHAVRNLIRLGQGTVKVHWSQLGFGRISSSVSQDTPRDLFGFKDGTANDQEHVIGRHKASGAPFGHTKERDEFSFTELPVTSHVRMAQSETNDGRAMLRRGYSFADGTDRAGHLDAGLFFLAFQRDPRQAFTPIQKKMAGVEAMTPFIQHNGSGLWACPPGARHGGFWGDTLLG